MSITVQESFTITFGTAPYTYSWTTADPCLSVAAASQSGTSTDGSISDVIFNADDDNCFPQNATVTVEDATGCTKQFIFAITSPCTVFTLSSISRIDTYTFSVNASQSATFNWLFDDDLFSGSSTTNVLTLTLNRQPLPGEQSFVSVIATNTAGCELTTSYTIDFDVPVASSIELTSPCAANFAATNYFDLPVTSVDPIDWSTLDVVVPSAITSSINALDQVKLQWRGTTPQTYTVPYTVASEKGIVSNQGLITWTISSCVEDSESQIGPFASSPVTNVSLDQIGDVIEIPITASEDYNPSLSTFVAATSQTLSVDGKTLTTVDGEAILYDEHFTYEQNSPGPPTNECETIMYQLTNWENQLGPIAKTAVLLQTIPPPNVQNKTICTSCFTSTPFLNLADVSLGDDLVDPSTMVLKTAPTLGTVKLTPTGRISYSQTITSSGSPDTFELTWRDFNGVLSNTALFTVGRDCVGQPTNALTDITCTAKTFDLQSLLAATHWIGPGAWGEVNDTDPGSYTSQGGTITSPSGVGTVDFTLINPGTYVFEKEVTSSGGAPPNVNCPLVINKQLTITYGPDPDVTITGTVNTSGDYYRVNFTIEGVASPSDVTVTVNTLPATLITKPNWIGNSGSFVVELSPGSNDIQIDATTICAGGVSDTVNVTY